MQSRPVSPAYRISTDTGLSPTIVITAVAVGVLMWGFLNRTAFGVLAGLAGRNPTMIVWQGARMSRLGLAGFVLGGALAGPAGAIGILGPNRPPAPGLPPAHCLTRR